MKNRNNFKNDLKKEMLVGWLSQWAENQRVREQSFLKIIGFLGVVIYGYAYVYHNKSSDQEFSLIFIVCEFILTFGSSIILAISYNYRRDQIVNAKILKKADELGSGKIFPESYDPCYSFKNARSFTWIPDFLASFYLIFPLTQIVLIVSYYYKINPERNICNLDYSTVILILFSIISLMISMYLPFRYYNKLIKIIDKEKNAVIK